MIRALLRTILIGGAAAAAAIRALRDPLPPLPATRRRRLRRIVLPKLVEYGALFAILGVLGFLGAASGVIPIRASAGHWPITRWFLELSMARSVSTHTIGMETPRLDDHALIVKGAGAYDMNCRGCHGSPDLPHPRVSRAMLPQPRYLPEVVGEWSARELFYIVKHGVKFTGMPAWPSQHRDDEVWAVVAFLLAFPKLDAATYERLVRGPAAPPAQPLLETCVRCHGVDGRGRAGAFPRLAGQRPTYLVNALQAFADGRRHSGFMEPVAAGLSPREMREIAAYFSVQAAPNARTSNDAIARGMTIATRGIPSQKVPACADCHGPAPSRKNDAYPLLAGQHADYLILQLELFKAERRGGSRYAHLMRPVAAGLTRQQMRDVAHYYQSLGAR